MRISDWRSDVCSSDLTRRRSVRARRWKRALPRGLSQFGQQVEHLGRYLFVDRAPINRTQCRAHILFLRLHPGFRYRLVRFSFRRATVRTQRHPPQAAGTMPAKSLINVNHDEHNEHDDAVMVRSEEQTTELQT